MSSSAHPITDFVVDYENFVYGVNVTTRTDISICPAGFICNETHKASCDDIRALSIYEFKFGDIHAGVYCPENNPFYRNCPIGSYCPNSSARILCPAGHFCPHKTADYRTAFVCKDCPEGAERLYRSGDASIILISILGFAGLFYIIHKYFRRHLKKIRMKLEGLRSLVLQKQDVRKFNHSHEKQLDKLRPKLEIINRRLRLPDPQASLSEPSFDPQSAEDDNAEEVATSVGRSSTVLRITDNEFYFDVESFFEVLDVSQNNLLDYDELNKVLQFGDLELKAFVKRMNQLGGSSDSNNGVSKETFCQFFLDVLEETANFSLTAEEAGARWDEICQDHGLNKNGEINAKHLYMSNIAKFLTDVQINSVIRKLRVAKLEANGLLDYSEQTYESYRPGEPSNRSMGLERPISSAFLRKKKMSHIDNGISRDFFCQHYPDILEQVLLEEQMQQSPTNTGGMDICFTHLSLEVKVGNNNSHKVVNDVTGRVQRGKMTAVMGGSGAGKTSLLNALCGRAFYGEVKGDVKINGHSANIEQFSDSIGFVPQDDIVFAELTVRENLIYSGRLRLPRGTPLWEIEDLADQVLANLGLARKADTIVGDVRRRGVSGGEKKRVNIGLELMAQGSALFLDEPTSGLDSSSALLVMSSLKQLVVASRVTVCTVIHQPRKFIFELFDSLILLGVGGRIVYHGPATLAEAYFNKLGYTMPPGEALADWLIDISTGGIVPDHGLFDLNDTEAGSMRPSERSSDDIYSSTFMGKSSAVISQEFGLTSRRRLSSITQQHVTTRTAPSGTSSQKAQDEAKLLREVLYQCWTDHFNMLENREIYDAPDPSDLPESIITPTTMTQFLLQLRRMLLIAWRNRVTKLVETLVIIATFSILGGVSGVLQVTVDDNPLVPFEILIAGREEVLQEFFPPLFAFATRATPGILSYVAGLSIVSSVVIALTASKAITEKQLEFFREAGNGVSISAYFLAVNVHTSLEQGLQVFLGAVVAVWIRSTIATNGVQYLSFLLLAWTSVSWAIFIAIIVEPSNAVLVIGFFMALMGFLFGGSNRPNTFSGESLSARRFH